MSDLKKALGPWFKSNYEKIALVSALIALLVSALFLLLKINEVKSGLASGAWIKPKVEKATEPVDVARYDAILQALNEPYAKDMEFTKYLFSLPEEKPPDLGTLDTDADGMDDQFEVDNGLDRLDPNDAYADSDGDGFTNIEEFRSKTDLRDEKKYPAITAKLRMVGVTDHPFMLRFQGVQELSEGVRQFQINLRSLERTYWAKLGDEVEGFKLVEFEPKKVMGRNKIMRDVSILTLEKGAKRVPLRKGETKTEYELTAVLVLTLDGSRYRVRAGDELILKDHKYKVIDIEQHKVLIRDADGGAEVWIGRMTDADRGSVPRRGLEPKGGSRPEELIQDDEMLRSSQGGRSF